MVFPADPSVGLSLKFSSMGCTVWMADLKHEKRQFFLGQQGFFQRIHAAKLFGGNNSLVQYVKQLVDYILTEEVSRL